MLDIEADCGHRYPMPNKPNKQLAILDRRRQVAALYVQGWTQTDIGEHLNISQASVSDDLKCIRQDWRESETRDFDAAVRDLQLQKLMGFGRRLHRSGRTNGT